MDDFALSVRHTFADALQIVRETHSEKPHRTGLRVAILQAMAGDYPAAIHTAQSITNRGARGNALGRVAALQSGRGSLDAALDTAAQITAQGEQEARIARIASDAAEQKRFAEAVAIAERLAGMKRDNLLLCIAGRMHDAGDAMGAYRLGEQITHPETRVFAESSFWTHESRNAPVETKVSFAGQIPDMRRRLQVLLDLAKKHGLPDALALAEAIMRSAPAVPSRYDRGQLAEAQASAGNVGDAEKTLAATGAGDGWLSPSVDVIAVLAKRGNIEDALRLAAQVPAGHGRSFALAGVVDALAASGDFDRAQTVARGMDAASAVPPEYALREIAKAQARRGDFDAARATASNLKSEKYRGEALQVIEHEERKAAGVLPFSWQAHWEQARTHPLSRYRFAAQFQLALEREKTGGWNAAKPLYEEAFVTAQTMTAALIRAESFALLLFATRDD